MVPLTSHKVSRVSWYFDTACPFVFPYGAFTLSGLLSQYRSVTLSITYCSLLTLQCTHRSLGSFPSLAATQEIDVSFFSSGYLDVSVPGFPSIRYGLAYGYLRFTQVGFPFRNLGSKDICSSPKLIAAYHVFHRLLVPRHPPYALTCLTKTRIVFSYIPAAQIAFCAPWSRVFLGSSWFVFIG